MINTKLDSNCRAEQVLRAFKYLERFDATGYRILTVTTRKFLDYEQKSLLLQGYNDEMEIWRTLNRIDLGWRVK